MKKNSSFAIKLALPVVLLVAGIETAFGQFGQISAPFISCLSNSCSGCPFPSSAGWDRYFVITNDFLGPNATNIISGAIIDTSQSTNLVVSTCASANGTNLVTGIQIVNYYFPQTKTCATNDPNCTTSTNLSTATMALSTSPITSVYRATVYFKSSTTNGLTNITVNYAYTNH